MKIIRKTAEAKFSSLAPGDVFNYDGYTYMRIDDEGENAVNLGDGELASFEDHEIIVPHPAAFLTLE
jgi:hypothetical protein